MRSAEAPTGRPRSSAIRAGRSPVPVDRKFVELLEPRLWLIRIPAGNDRFVRKEDLHRLVPELAEWLTTFPLALSWV